jgi:hypothetical protein
MTQVKSESESVTISSLRRVEPVFKNKFTIVLEKRKLKDFDDGLDEPFILLNERKMLKRFLDQMRRILNKNEVFLSSQTLQDFPTHQKEMIGMPSVNAVIGCEVQSTGRLIHFHGLIGNLVRFKYETPPVIREFQTSNEFCELVEKEMLKNYPFNDWYKYWKDLSYPNFKFEKYHSEDDSEGPSWIQYICKERKNPFRSNGLSRTIRNTFKTDQSTGIISDELKRQGIMFSRERNELDFNKRLYVLGMKGGNTNE